MCKHSEKKSGHIYGAWKEKIRPRTKFPSLPLPQIINGPPLSLPPVKNLPSWNSSKPNSSKPTPIKAMLCASNCGFIELNSTAHSLHNCHPKRRRKAMTAVCLLQRLWTSTICNQISKFAKKLLNYFEVKLVLNTNLSWGDRTNHIRCYFAYFHLAFSKVR